MKTWTRGGARDERGKWSEEGAREKLIYPRFPHPASDSVWSLR